MIILRQILAATDFSEASRAAVDRADVLASAFDAQLHLLHVVDEPLHEPWVGYAPAGELVHLIERLQREARVRLAGEMSGKGTSAERTVLASTWGNPGDEILKYADCHDIDLIVCGTHGRRGWNHLMVGSVAERVVRRARCPVLTVRAGAGPARAAA
jgi:nucleotide-binding universal stress UspA family protein